jgi:hypothetical protein
MACHKDLYRYRHAPCALDGEADFFNAYMKDRCPSCGSLRIEKNGYRPDGIRRWRCLDCGRTFTPATGTIFESRKLPVADWTEFLLEVFSFESLSEITRSGRRSRTTPPFWLAKLFCVLEGVQDDTVLSGRVQLDETFYPVARKDQKRHEDGTKLRGAYSTDKLCIGIVCDDSGKSLFKLEGFGKTSKDKTWDAFATHIKPGSVLVHDQENGHNKLVKELGLRSEVYPSRKYSRLPDAQNPLADVNHLCYLLKRFLGSHSGFDRGNLEGYLDLFWVMMNPPAEKMEKAAFVLNRAMDNPKYLSYRDFYSHKGSSEAHGVS